jgi:type IV secretion system protein VirB10
MPADQTLPEEEEYRTSRASRFTGRQKLGFAAAGVALCGGLVGGHYLLSRGDRDEAKRVLPASIGQPFKAPAKPVAAPAPAEPAANTVPRLPPAPAPAIAPTPIKLKVDRGMASKITAIEGPTSRHDSTGDRGGAEGADENGTGAVHDNLSKALTPSDTGKASYARMLDDPDYTIPAGSLIQCVLDTAINSQLVGFTRCHIPDKAGVWNASGTGIMLEAGTVITGQIRSGVLQGQNRLFVLWSRARTPSHVLADLNSPASDPLGRSGIPGIVDNHFWTKLFNTAIYSFVGYGPQIVSSALQKQGGSNNNYLSFVTPQQNLAEKVLEQEINIPPTLEVNQGDPVTIFVGHDINFSKVYKFRTINNRRVLSGEY